MAKAEDLAWRPSTVLRPSGPWTAATLSVAVQRQLSELTDYLLASRTLYHILFQAAGVSEETMQLLRDLFRQTLARAMTDSAIVPIDPDILMRFVRDGLH